MKAEETYNIFKITQLTVDVEAISPGCLTPTPSQYLNKAELGRFKSYSWTKKFHLMYAADEIKKRNLQISATKTFLIFLSKKRFKSV
jgi:hypothetical protein